MDKQDLDFLRLACNLAEQNSFKTHSNPSVGCIILSSNNKILSYGVSEKSGGRHAEIVALDSIDSNGYLEYLNNATLYVTLEPCCHFGKTPPCVDRIIASGIKKVVIGLIDPNPIVNGKGISKLIQNNIQVIVCDDDQLINKIKFNLRGFLKFHTYQSAWVRLKIASSLDGVMALNNNNSKWITAEDARTHNHYLRARAGAIVSSFNTVRKDNALLNVRINEAHQPIRVILDSYCQGLKYIKKSGINLNILQQQNIYPLIWVCSDKANRYDIQEMQKYTKVITVPLVDEYIDIPSLLEYLYTINVNEIQVEAGSALTTSFITKKLFDEIALYQAPYWLGSGKRILGELELEDVNIAKFKVFNYEKLEQDMMLNLIHYDNCLNI